MLYARENNNEDDMEIVEKIKKLKAVNFSDKDIATVLCTLYGFNKNKVYKLALAL